MMPATCLLVCFLGIGLEAAKHVARLALQLILHGLEHLLGLIHVGRHHALHGRLLEIQELVPEISLQMRIIGGAVDASRLILQLLLEINEGLHVVFQILAEHALHRAAVEANEAGKQLAREHRHAAGFLFKNDLEQDAAGQVFAALGIDYLENLKFEDQILHIPQGDVRARLGIVKTTVGVFLDQAYRFRHAAILKTRVCVQRSIIAQRTASLTCCLAVATQNHFMYIYLPERLRSQTFSSQPCASPSLPG